MQPRVKDPHALLTLPEFIREAVPASVIRADPKALLTLPEFVKESPPARLIDDDSDVQGTPHEDNKSSRHRSLSAPPLSWLRSSSSRSSSANSSSGTSQSRPPSTSSGMLFLRLLSQVLT